MIDAPQTIEQAKAHSYGMWAGNSKGNPYHEGCCAYEIWGDWISRQCGNKNGKGVNGLYCGTHAKKVQAHAKRVKPKA